MSSLNLIALLFTVIGSTCSVYSRRTTPLIGTLVVPVGGDMTTERSDVESGLAPVVNVVLSGPVTPFAEKSSAPATDSVTCVAGAYGVCRTKRTSR